MVIIRLRRDFAIEGNITGYAIEGHSQSSSFIVVNCTGPGAVGSGIFFIRYNGPACIPGMFPGKFAKIIRFKVLRGAGDGLCVGISEQAQQEY